MMQIVPQYAMVAGGHIGFNMPLFVQPIAMAVPMADISEPSIEEAIKTLRVRLMQLGELQPTVETQNIRQRLENLQSRPQSSAVVSESEALVEKLVKELLLRCKQVHPVEVWTLLRNKGCQFLAPYQSTILQNLIFVLREHTVLPRKTLIELIVEKCQKNGASVSKTIVSRVVQLLYRSGCFIIHKDNGGVEETNLNNASKNTRMQLREDFFNYQTLRRTHDGLIVQWAHEEGLYLSADRWSMMMYQDKTHKAYMQTIMDQKTIPLVRWIDALYQHARTMPPVAKCIPVLQEYSSVPTISSSERASEMEVTRSHIAIALRCVLSLTSAYLAVANVPLPAAQAPRPVAVASEDAVTRGRPVYGARQSPMASPNGVYDQEMPSSPSSFGKQLPVSSVNISERASPSSVSAGTDINERDSDNEGRAQMSPQVKSDQMLQEQAMLDAIRFLCGATNEPAQPQHSEWDAWKWSGPHNLLNGTKKPAVDEVEMAPQDDDFSAEEALIAPMLSELIDEKANSSWNTTAHLGRAGMANDGIYKQKPYARMMSTTAVENLMSAPAVSANSFAHQFQGGFSSFLRVASLEDENYLHL